ncbi:MAG TPA: V-type ATP synthase subunit E [Gemmatimonadales bacterium]
MSIDALLERLAREGDAEAAELISAAQQQAHELLGRADSETERRRAEALDRLQQAERRAVEAETAAAARRYREAQMVERAQLLDRIFAEAERELRSVGSDAYQPQLPALLRATLRFLEATPAVMLCRPELAAPLERLCAEHAGVTVRAVADAAPGVLGESADGAVLVDNTLPALLQRCRADLAIAVAAQLEA